MFDEVITGFGRTGQTFAAQSFGVTPDIMTMAKGITNGALPMGAVAVSERIHDTIMAAAPDGAIELFHGYTYSGHPMASAAAIASLDIYNEQKLFARAAEIAPYFEAAMHSLKGFPNVIDIRNIGLIGIVELAPRAGKPGTRGYETFVDCFRSGVLVRPAGDTLAFSPPLVVEKPHIDRMVETLGAAIERAA